MVLDPYAPASGARIDATTRGRILRATSVTYGRHSHCGNPRDAWNRPSCSRVVAFHCPVARPGSNPAAASACWIREISAAVRSSAIRRRGCRSTG